MGVPGRELVGGVVVPGAGVRGESDEVGECGEYGDLWRGLVATAGSRGRRTASVGQRP